MASYYQRIVVLINRRAGKHDAASVDQVADAFRTAGAHVDIRVVDGSSLAAEAAGAIARGSTVVVAAGGDGTVGAVASALVGTGVALGVLPLGTLNHFAKDVGIPTDPGEAARAIVTGRTTLVDVGHLNGRSFVNNASVGMYARLIAERAAMQRLGRGKWIAHGLAAVRVWRRYRRLRVQVRSAKGEGRGKWEVASTVTTPFVFVGNNEYQLSGLELGGRKTLTGERLHVCMAPGMSRGDVARMIIAAVLGNVYTMERFESFLTPAVAIDAGNRPLEASIDGEVVTLDSPLTCRIVPRSLRVIVP
jgi:diacylglycerol kinase family enzyme